MSEKGLTCRNGDKHAQIGSRRVQNLQSHMLFFFFLYSILSENITRTETSPLSSDLSLQSFVSLLLIIQNPEDSSSWATAHRSGDVACLRPGLAQTEPDVAGQALFGHGAALSVPVLF